MIKRFIDAAAEMLDSAHADLAAGAEIEPGELTLMPPVMAPARVRAAGMFAKAV